MMKWLFRRLFPVYGGPVCFLQSETVVQTKRRNFIVFARQNSNEFFGATFAALARGLSDRHFERGEGPEDEVDITCTYYEPVGVLISGWIDRQKK